MVEKAEKVLLIDIPEYMIEMYGLWFREKFNLKAEFSTSGEIKGKLRTDNYKAIIIDSGRNKHEQTLELIEQIREVPKYKYTKILVSSAGEFNLPNVIGFYSLTSKKLEKILS